MIFFNDGGLDYAIGKCGMCFFKSNVGKCRYGKWLYFLKMRQVFFRRIAFQVERINFRFHFLLYGVNTVYGLPSSFITSFFSKMTWSLNVYSVLPFISSNAFTFSSRAIA